MEKGNTNTKAYVYFIYESDSLGKFKIGRSVNPERRLKNLQTGNSRLLQIYKTIECPSKNFAKYLEGALHLHYLSSCQGGEWFLLTVKEIEKILIVVAHLIKNDIPVDLFEEVWNLQFLKKEVRTIPFFPVFNSSAV